MEAKLLLVLQAGDGHVPQREDFQQQCSVVYFTNSVIYYTNLYTTCALQFKKFIIILLLSS